MVKKLTAELFGTFVLVFCGCGSALFAAAFPEVGIGLHGVSLAFGITVIGCAYALGSVSGCHLNPAVTLGLTVGGRASAADFVGYVLAQVGGAVLAAAALLVILQGGPEGYVAAEGGLAANGYADHSPGNYNVVSCFVAEAILTFIFVMVIMGSTSPGAPSAMAGLAIGLTLTLVHLVGIPITNLSVNPARSTGPALFVGGWAVQQLWLFWAAPMLGAFAAGVAGRWLYSDPDSVPAA